MKRRLEEILRAKLIEAFCPLRLEIQDQSFLHKGHQEGSKESGTHFKVLIVSDFFSHKTRIQRHQAVYTVLKQEMNEIHALELILKSPEEAASLSDK